MKKSEDHEVSFTSVSGWRISKKLGVTLAVTCAAACVAVGLIVYYVGVGRLECANNGGDSKAVQQTSPDRPSPTSKKEVRLMGCLHETKFYCRPT
jgi:hypothetical protein